MLCEVRQILHITLTIPVMSATAELTFSAMRRLQSTMTQTFLMMLCCYTYIHREKADLHAIPNEFKVQMKEGETVLLFFSAHCSSQLEGLLGT